MRVLGNCVQLCLLALATCAGLSGPHASPMRSEVQAQVRVLCKKACLGLLLSALDFLPKAQAATCTPSSPMHTTHSFEPLIKQMPARGHGRSHGKRAAFRDACQSKDERFQTRWQRDASRDALWGRHWQPLQLGFSSYAAQGLRFDLRSVPYRVRYMLAQPSKVRGSKRQSATFFSCATSKALR